MSQDALTLAAVREELAGLLVGGRVQRVVRPAPMVLGMEIYTGTRHQLLLDAEPEGTGVALADQRLRRGVETASPLLLLLRKRVQGARLSGISQPALERVLRFSFAGQEGAVDLVCEIMGRLSNLILVDARGVILDCARRVPARLNRYRVLLPGQPYVPPPPQHRLSLRDLDATTLAAALDGEPGLLSQRLVRTVAGMSPLLAREVCHRVTGDAHCSWPLDLTTPGRLIEVLTEMLSLPETHAWAPSVGYQRRDGELVPVAVAPYALTHCDAYEPVPSISRAALLPLAGARPHDPYAAVRAELCALVEEGQKRLRARLASLEQGLATREEIDVLRLQGETVLAMARQILPGQQELVCRDADVTGDEGPEGERELRIPLDPALSAAENAQALFRAYRKRQSAQAQVPGLIEAAARELDYLEQLRADIDLAGDRPALEAVRVALEKAGHLRATRRRAPVEASGPLQMQSSDGSLILVGRNSAQNEEITFRLSGPRDLWLHAHGVPGAHVVLRRSGDALDEEALLEAAGLAAYFSRAREQSLVPVDVTERRNVRRMPGGRPGMVTYRAETTLNVAPRGPESATMPGDS